MFSDLPRHAAPSLIVIGNFDGVHRGHQALLARAADQAKTLGLNLVAVTFEPHPRAFFHPDAAPPRLTGHNLKKFFLYQQGADAVVTLPFTEKLAKASADDFMTYLAESLQARHLVVGPDFSFGRDRTGDVKQLQSRFGFDHVSLCDWLTDHKGPVSSTRVRGALAVGELNEAVHLLNRAYIIETTDYCLLPDGIYPVWVQIEGKWQQKQIEITQNAVRSSFETAFLAFTGGEAPAFNLSLDEK